ncbi:MAG: hypothetical protein AAB779_03225, partial [Patescibacteria group bacterium]
MKIAIFVIIIVILEFLLEAYIMPRQKKSIWNKLSKKHHFSIWRYLLFFGIPLATVAGLVEDDGLSLVASFFAFAVVGTLFEWMVGFAYHKTMGSRLWTYHFYSINGYTSFASIPLWGLAGVIGWAVF